MGIGFIVIVLLVLFISVFIFVVNQQQEDVVSNSKKVYQGPVKLTDDEEYFRGTGITKEKIE